MKHAAQFIQWIGVAFGLLGAGSVAAVTNDLAVGLGLNDQQSAVVGGSLYLRLSVTNLGPDTANSVVVSNTLPPTVAFIGVITPGVASASFSGGIVCQLGALAPAKPTNIVLQTRPLDTNSLNLTAGVAAQGTDPFPSNNVAELSLNVAPPSLAVGLATVSEAVAGASVSLPVWLPVPLSREVSVEYQTSPVTASAGSDFVAASGLVVFPPGVRTQFVSIVLLDDALFEGTETFRVRFTNATNALISWGISSTITLLDNDPPPAVSISDVTVPEGDFGTTEATFDVTLSAPSGLTTHVHFQAVSQTASVFTDYVPTNGFITFAPGATRQIITIHVKGNTLNESNETFLVRLTSASPATISDHEGQCTILNDDALPGRLDHFRWEPIPSIQVTNRPVAVTLTALDAFERPASNFTGVVFLVVTQWYGQSNPMFFPRAVSNFVDAVWSGHLVFSNVLGTQFTLVADDGQEHTGASNPFDLLQRLPLILRAPQSASEGAGALVDAGQVSLLYPESQDVIVQLSSSNTNEARVPAAVVIPPGQTTAVFTVTVVDDIVLDGTRTSTLSASAAGFTGASAGMAVHDDETATLTLSLSNSLPEGAGTIPAGRLSVSAPPAAGVLVFLTSSDGSEISSTAVFLGPGQTSAVINLTVADDDFIEAPQTVTITAHVENWQDATGNVVVQDDERSVMEFSASVALGLHEGEPTRTNGIWITLGGRLETNLVLSLLSSDPTEVTVPPTVVVPAGQSGVVFDLTPVDDSLTDGTQPAVITALAPGFPDALRTVYVEDNDVHHFTFAALSANRPGSTPFPISVTARDVNDLRLTWFDGASVRLSAAGDGGPLTLSPTNLGSFDQGQWNGVVTLPYWNVSNVVLTASDGLGHAGQSTPFALVPPAWTRSLRITGVRLNGADVEVEFATTAGFLYSLERNGSLSGSAWTPVSGSLLGAGSLGTITDAGGALQPERFYRLLVRP